MKTLEYHLCIRAYDLGYLGLISPKSPCASDTLKLGNSPFRAYSKTFGNRYFQQTFSKISFNILLGIVRLLPMANRVHLWRNDMSQFTFSSHGYCTFYYTAMLKRIWLQTNQIKNSNQEITKLFLFLN